MDTVQHLINAVELELGYPPTEADYDSGRGRFANVYGVTVTDGVVSKPMLSASPKSSHCFPVTM